jgi:hypothetical protein
LFCASEGKLCSLFVGKLAVLPGVIFGAGYEHKSSFFDGTYRLVKTVAKEKNKRTF